MLYRAKMLFYDNFLFEVLILATNNFKISSQSKTND